MHTKNLFGIMKLFLLKFSVGIIVLEGIICTFLISTGKTPYSDDDGDDSYNSDEKTQRGYCEFIWFKVILKWFCSYYYMYTFSLEILLFVLLNWCVECKRIVVLFLSVSAGALVLLELMILSVVYLYAFGIKQITPSAAPGYDTSKDTITSDKITFTGFVCSLWALHDVFGTQGLTAEIASPLNPEKNNV